MRCPSRTEDETSRLQAISDYGLHLERATNLDPVVQIAARMFGCPIAAVNIIGDTEVFLASSFGISDYERSRDYSFCAHAILQEEVMVVEDAADDPRFHDNPLVTEGLIRFYAGVPLRVRSGHALGALCIIDGAPHTHFANADRMRLKELASFVMDKIELRRLERAATAPPVTEPEIEPADREVLQKLANYDSITGLPNRNLLQKRFEAAMEDLHAPSLIITDLDGFTDINHTLGHEAGNRALRLIAERLVKVMPEDASVFSIANAEFATLVLGDRDPPSLDELARNINAAIVQPMAIEGHEVRIAGNCGAAHAPDHGRTFDELLSSANLALLHARSIGRGGSFMFMPALRTEALARRMQEAELHRALERNEFALFYQPQFRLADDTLVGAEALIRWKHPTRGLLPPAAFLGALENGLLAVDAGKWILETACAQAVAWRRRNPSFRMSVNLFAAQLRTGDLPEVVTRTIEALGLPPHALELEITENIALSQQHSALSQLEVLKRLGIALSFDDFGTGHASLNLLRDYPITSIKIDKSFTQVVQTSPKDRAIVKGVIGMAQDLGLRVVAEGIESSADCDYLRALGCDKGQGYFFGKPVPADLFAERYLARPEETDDRSADAPSGRLASAAAALA